MVRIVRFSLENVIGFEARNRSPDLRLALYCSDVKRSSHLRSDRLGRNYLPLTVAGQWRIYTAFPSIPRSLNCERSQASIARRLKISSGRVDFPGMGKLAVSLALLTTCAFAASDDEAAIQSTFVKPCIEALRARDKTRIEQLLHPAVRACITPSTQRVF